MLKVIKQLKQQNPSAFSFALAGMIALFFAVTGLALLGHGLLEQKQIAKQVGDLQITGRGIGAIVSSNMSFYQEATAFSEFEKNVNSFNQQWTDFKQQHDYSDKIIKRVDTVWQRVNSNSKNVLANKAEIIRLNTARTRYLENIKSMQQSNENLLNALTPINKYSNQLLSANNLTIYLSKEEASLKILFEMPEYFMGYEDDEMVRTLGEIDSILSSFLSEGYDVKKIEDEKLQAIIKKEKIIFENMSVLYKQLYFEGRYKLNQVKELQSAIYRDVPELKSALSKLNHHKLNTGLMVLTLCSWLCVFACGYGYVGTLKTR